MIDSIKKNASIILILVIASILRFWKFWSIPFSHDELSALSRTRFDSVTQVIEHGVRPDGHPAGIQILLWLQTQIGGYENWWIKLPFLLSGVASVWLVYIIGTRLFSKNAGLTSAVLLATMQYAVTFSQWARPYSIGLLLVLAFTWTVLRLKDEEHSQNFWKWGVVFSVLAALAGYVHYFALLQCILVTALFAPSLNRMKLSWIAGSSMLGFILWVPHLGITLKHLRQGGIGEWLDKPESFYWAELLGYAFHFSWFFAGIVIAVVVLPMMKVWKWNYRHVMLIMLAILPFTLAYYYSLNVNPLLNQNVVFFSLPFFLLWIGSFTANQKSGLHNLSIWGMAVVAIFTLVQERQHFDLNYHSEYETALNELSRHQSDNEAMAALIDLRADFVELLQEEELIELSDYQFVYPLLASGELQTYLDSEGASHFFFAMNSGTEPEVFAAVLDHFPCILKSWYFSSGEAYLLGQSCDSRLEISSQLIEDEMVFPDSPYSSSFDWSWGTIGNKSNTHIVTEYRGVTGNASIVLEVKSASDVELWRGVELQKFKSNAQVVQRGYHVFYNSEFVRDSTDRVKSYLWLNDGGGIHLTSMKAYSVPLNPNKFGLYRPF